jgi:hypothetical protein
MGSGGSAETRASKGSQPRTCNGLRSITEGRSIRIANGGCIAQMPLLMPQS